MEDTSLTGAKSDLHRKAQGWVITKFKDSKKSIRLDDMDTGELTGKGTVPLKGKETCSFTYKISSRDRGYRCEIFEIGVSSASDTAIKSLSSYSSGSSPNKNTTGKVDTGIRTLMKDLHARMKSDKNFSTPSPAPMD